MRPPPARGDGTDPGGTRGRGPTRSRSQSPSRAGGSIFGHHHIRQTLDRLQVAYLGLVATQVSALLLYEWRVASGSLVLALGLVTSLVGPGLSVVVGVRVFQQRRLSRGFDVASAALTYVVTCISFAIVYAIIAERVPHAFTLPAGEADPIGFGSALYFSVVTITTTGFGDIAPLRRAGPHRRVLRDRHRPPLPGLHLHHGGLALRPRTANRRRAGAACPVSPPPNDRPGFVMSHDVDRSPDAGTPRDDEEALRLADDVAGRRDWRLWGTYLPERQLPNASGARCARIIPPTAMPGPPSPTPRPAPAPTGGARTACSGGRTATAACACPPLCGTAGTTTSRSACSASATPTATTARTSRNSTTTSTLTPTGSYAKALYKYPQAAFPYAELVEENGRRGLGDPEYELLDTGVFDENRYFDLVVEYAKRDADDNFVRIHREQPRPGGGGDRRPAHPHAAQYLVLVRADGRRRQATVGGCRGHGGRHRRGSGAGHLSVRGRAGCRRPHGGTPCSPRTSPTSTPSPAAPGGGGPRMHSIASSSAGMRARPAARTAAPRQPSCSARRSRPVPLSSCGLRLARDEGAGVGALDVEAFEGCLARRIAEADDFYAAHIPDRLGAEARAVARQAYAGLLWSKTGLRLRRRHLDRRRPGAAAAGGPRGPPQRELAPHVAARRDLDAGQVGISVVRGVGPRLPPRPDGAHRPGLRQVPTPPDVERALPPSERRAPRLRVELRRREPARPRCCGAGRVHDRPAPNRQGRHRLPRAGLPETGAELHVVGQPQRRCGQRPVRRRVPGARQHRPVRQELEPEGRHDPEPGRRHGLEWACSARAC